MKDYKKKENPMENMRGAGGRQMRWSVREGVTKEATHQMKLGHDPKALKRQKQMKAMRSIYKRDINKYN